MAVWNLSFLALNIASIVSGQTTEKINPCEVYNTLHDDNGRSPNKSLTEKAICDRRIDSGWYRMGDSGLHNQCVQPGKCGTVYPIWLNGSVPSAHEGIVERTACISTDQTCCDMHLSVKVKMCQGFPVFLLQPTPGCSMAYCYESAIAKTTRSTTRTTTFEIGNTNVTTSDVPIPEGRPSEPYLLPIGVILVLISVVLLILALIFFVASRRQKVAPPPEYSSTINLQPQEKSTTTVWFTSHQ